MDLNIRKVVATETPGSNWTTRGMYPNDVSAGDEISIPWALGKHRFILDDGGLGKAAAGALFVLLAQRDTPGDAIIAGHKALGEAANAALNDYAWAKWPDVLAPMSADVQQMANQIQGEVSGAVKNAESWYDYFAEQDFVLGYSYIFKSLEDLTSLAEQQPPLRQGFNNRIERVFTTPPNDPDGIVVDYAFRGTSDGTDSLRPAPGQYLHCEPGLPGSPRSTREG